MYRNILAFVLAAFTLWGCGGKDNANTIVSGNATGLKGTKLYLLKVTPDKLLKTDSAVVDSLGNFVFRLSLTTAEYLTVTSSVNHAAAIFIAAPNENIELILPRTNPWGSMVVKGSTGTMYLRQLNDSLAQLKGRLLRIQQQFDTLKYSYKYDSLRAVLKKAYLEEIDGYRNSLRALIMSQKPTLALINAVYQKFDSASYVLNQRDDIKYYLYVDSMLYKRYSLNSVVKAFHETVSGVKHQLNNRKLNLEAVAEGTEAPNFVLPSFNGDTVRLQALRGKYVLINFWAPWAKSSAEANKNLEAVYAKYRPYGFEIVQVSLARDRNEHVESLTPAMKQWKHVSEYKIWNSAIVKEYNVTSIPANILVNRQGLVVARNVFNNNLYDTLRWYLVRPYLLRRDSLLVNEPKHF